MGAAAAMAVGGPMLGASMGSIGKVMEGESGAQAAEYNAGMAEQNAGLAVQQAAVEEQRQRIMAKKGIGSARAGISASGITLEGSAADVLESSAANAELDSLLIRHAGESKAKMFGAEASLNRYKAAGSRIGGYMGAATSFVGGASSAMSMKRGG